MFRDCLINTTDDWKRMQADLVTGVRKPTLKDVCILLCQIVIELKSSPAIVEEKEKEN